MESEQKTKDYELLILSEVELEDKMKIDDKEFEKMTELEREWALFKKTELKEELEKWIQIKRKLDNEKTSNNAVDTKIQ